MAVRLIVGITAAPGKGSDLGKLYKARCEEIVKEPGCEQFDIFRNVSNPDQLVVLERWADQAALDTHLARNKLRPPIPLGYRLEKDREDYIYNRTNRAEYDLV